MYRPSSFVGLIPNLRTIPVSLRFRFNLSNPLSPASWLAQSSCSTSSPISTIARWRGLSTNAKPDHDLFDYTSGRWIINEPLRMAERRRVFNVDELRRLAAESVGRSSEDVLSFSKLAEGGFNRSFLVTMHDGFQMVARIPYPKMAPKSYGIASEVATMDFLRETGLPIPKVFGYSYAPNNAAETEYIFMEYVQGTTVAKIWSELDEADIHSIMRQVTTFEALMMSIKLPAGGSLYYTHDLKNLTGTAGIPLGDSKFSVGPDARTCMWEKKRSQLDVDRGPYKSVEAALVQPALKEKAYLQQFGRPVLPYDRTKREGCQYQEQSPSAHIENLERYLLLAPSLVPSKPSLRDFVLCHQDLNTSNIIVSRSSDSSTLRITGLLDWQNTAILPAFLHVGVPHGFQNWNDPVSDELSQPSLPENFDDMDEAAQMEAKSLYIRRLLHFHYVVCTIRCDGLHRELMEDPIWVWSLRYQLFDYAGEPWSGEILPLKVHLIQAVEKWDELRRLSEPGDSSGDPSATLEPCPISFEEEDMKDTKKLDSDQDEVSRTWAEVREYICRDVEGWVPNEHYEEHLARSRYLKEQILEAAETEQERAEIEEHYPFEDMDEEPYQ
ncbi:protein kinase subdomain-containing protein PKL/CAK/Fmp29 [Clavulina sp. PMI_390]|nr:protein kinase subdomain-containing protein PKL/CAK/Fmp29 [Clavulina sp. PMI_390]